MYIIPIAWIYVALMMAVAEATNSNGSVLGAVFTFLLYGVMPVALLLYFMGTPGRRRKSALQEREWAEQAARDPLPGEVAQTISGPHTETSESPPVAPGVTQNTSSLQPDASRHAPANAIAPVRKKA